MWQTTGWSGCSWVCSVQGIWHNLEEEVRTICWSIRRWGKILSARSGMWSDGGAEPTSHADEVIETAEIVVQILTSATRFTIRSVLLTFPKHSLLLWLTATCPPVSSFPELNSSLELRAAAAAAAAPPSIPIHLSILLPLSLRSYSSIVERNINLCLLLSCFYY